MDNAPKSASPDGRYVIHVDMWEARMSHWIECPTLSDARSGETLLRFNDDNWSLDSAQWQSDIVVKLSVRKYPGDHRPAFFEVLVDCAAKSAVVQGTPVPGLSQVEAALEDLYAKHRF